jgi:hypothetical protein
LYEKYLYGVLELLVYLKLEHQLTISSLYTKLIVNFNTNE